MGISPSRTTAARARSSPQAAAEDGAANPSATFAARESTAPEAPERGDSPTPGQGSLARDFLHVHFFGAGRNRAKPDVDFRAVWRRARVCRAKVHHALRYLDLVAPVPVAARVNAIASCQASVSVGAAPKGSVSEARNSHPIRHQQIERFSILASPSNLLLHVLRCPRGAGGRAFPLGPERRKAVQPHDFVPRALPCQVPVESVGVSQDKYDNPADCPHSQLKAKHTYHSHGEPIYPFGNIADRGAEGPQ